MKMLYALAISAMFVAGSATAKAPDTQPDAIINYSSLDGLFREFAPSRDGEGVYLRDRTNTWYFAKFESPCDALPRSPTLGFKKDVSNQIRSGTIVAVPNAGGVDECRIAQFTYSEAPPSGLRNRVVPRDGSMRGTDFPRTVTRSDMGSRPDVRTSIR